MVSAEEEVVSESPISVDGEDEDARFGSMLSVYDPRRRSPGSLVADLDRSDSLRWRAWYGESIGIRASRVAQAVLWRGGGKEEGRAQGKTEAKGCVTY